MRRHRRSVLAALSALATTALIMSPTAAYAAFDPTQRGGGDPEGGRWYLTQQGVYEAHQQGFKGQGVKVAIIDSRINVDLPDFAGAKLTIREPSFCTDLEGNPISTTTTMGSASHGTTMAGLIVGNGTEGTGYIGVAPEAEILYYNAFTLGRDYGADTDVSPFNVCNMGTVNEKESFTLAMRQAVTDGADVISISIGSNDSDALDEAILDALRAGIIIVTGFPNDEDYSVEATALANGTLLARAYDASGELMPNVKTGQVAADEAVDIVAPGVDIFSRDPDRSAGWDSTYLSLGNSDATALTSGMIAVIMSKYPEATGNQVMQSVLRNTEQGNGELRKDKTKQWGYGQFDLRKTLAVDPTQYPDINPELSKEELATPSYEEVMGTPGPTPTVPDNGTDTSDSKSWIIGAIALGGVAVIAITAVMVTRSRRKQHAPVTSVSAQGYPPLVHPMASHPHPSQGQPPPGSSALPPAGTQPFAPPPGPQPHIPPTGEPSNGVEEPWR